MENDDRNPGNTGGTAESGDARAGKGWGRRVIIGGIGAVVAVAAIGLAAAATTDFGRDFGMGFGPGRHAMHANMGMGFGGFWMGHVLDEIDATPEQEDKLWDIIDGARSELRPTFREFRETREQIAGILGAPTVDRAALERLRSERVASIDQASRRMTTALADAAEVLTPEQRAKLVERFKERGWRGRW